MVNAEQIVPGIYIYRWIDQVDMRDARASFEAVKRINRGQPYVAIVDMQDIRRVPQDIAAMRALIKEEVAEGLRGYVVYGAPRIVETFIKPLSLLAPTTYTFAQDWDIALQLAHVLLKGD